MKSPELGCGGLGAVAEDRFIVEKFVMLPEKEPEVPAGIVGRDTDSTGEAAIVTCGEGWTGVCAEPGTCVGRKAAGNAGDVPPAAGGTDAKTGRDPWGGPIV